MCSKHVLSVLQASACNTDTTQTQPHQISNTQRTKNKTTDVVIQQHSRKLLRMDILMSETCWVHKKWNKIASDIKLFFYSSTITMTHGPINIRWTKCILLVVLTENSCVFKMALIAVRPREIPIYVLFCALSLLIAKPKLRKETDTKLCFTWDSHPRGRQWSSEVCSYCNTLSSNLVVFSLFWNAISMLKVF